MRATTFTFASILLFATPLVASAESLTFTLENKTPNMVVQAFVSPADGGKSIELLHKKGLFGGKSRQLTINDGSDACVYKLRLVFEDDSFEDVRDKVDFCETGTYTIDD
ncbi:hypothetical protein [Rhizobium glycinendophyticum]|uniref:Uncharacterized protein n=1 Tax=Rhizobium glycinendophyticum TaxID=2589807 RepID=A0A504UCL9_9HYPH|nr:hypothetical protein [Rhizobium glycinendophyticum]TPP10900.1 hypothetical protein FJQ55_08695 [Rhizobium glycinendophyticum]